MECCKCYPLDLHTWNHRNSGDLQTFKQFYNSSMDKVPVNSAPPEEPLAVNGCYGWQSHFSWNDCLWKMLQTPVENHTAHRPVYVDSISWTQKHWAGGGGGHKAGEEIYWRKSYGEVRWRVERVNMIKIHCLHPCKFLRINFSKNMKISHIF